MLEEELKKGNDGGIVGQPKSPDVVAKPAGSKKQFLKRKTGAKAQISNRISDGAQKKKSYRYYADNFGGMPAVKKGQQANAEENSGGLFGDKPTFNEWQKLQE